MSGYQCIHQVFLSHKIQDCIPVGCIPHTRWPYLPACTVQGGYLVWGVCSGGCLVWGMSARGCLVRWGALSVRRGAWSLGEGGCLVPGGVVSKHALRQTPPWTEFLTHATENITLPQTSFAGGKNKQPNNLTFITIFEKKCNPDTNYCPSKAWCRLHKMSPVSEAVALISCFGNKSYNKFFQKRQKQICTNAAHCDTGLMWIRYILTWAAHSHFKLH